MLLIPIIYLVAGNVSDRKFLKILLSSLIIVMAILSVIGIVKYLSGVGGLEGRLKLYHHYMTSGGILMIVSLITFSLVSFAADLKIRIMALFCGLLMLPPLIFTFTRSSWLGFLSGLTMIIIMRSKKAIFGIIIVMLLFVLFAPQSFRERAFSIFDPQHPTNVERLYMWRAGIEIIKDYPLTGVGDIDLGKIYDEYKSSDAKQRHGHLHNNLLTIGATLGIPGIIVLLALFVKIFFLELNVYNLIPRHEWLLKGTVLGCMASFIGFQINGLFEWNFGDAEISMLLWMTVGFSLAVKNMKLTDNN